VGEKPNILVIVSDHHHPRMAGYLGHPYLRTANLDALAAGGVAFRRAYCNCPVCGPARSTYMSGKYVFETGHWSNGVPVPADLTTWAQRVAQAGIESALLGKIDFPGPLECAGFAHCKLSCRRRAFDPYPRTKPEGLSVPGFRRAGSRRMLIDSGPAVPEGRHDPARWYGQSCGLYDQDRAVTDWTLDYLKEKAKSPGEPWALHVGYEYPHWPYMVPRKYFDMYYPDRVELPFDARFPNPDLPPAVYEFQQWNDFGEVTEEMLRRTLSAFYGMITCIDDMIGEIIDCLKATGQFDNTYVIYTTDHGDSMGEHGLFFKLSPMEGSIGVPLILCGPGIPAGRLIDTPVSLVDMYPTVLEMCGLRPEHDTHGASWLPLARGEAGRRDDTVFCEYHGVGFRGSWYVLMRGDYKYTWYEYYPPTLYNLADDPREMHNLAGERAQAGRLEDFERRLRQICDPSAVSARAKKETGLITPDGIDLTADKSIYGFE
jgi:choline-sulfatase